MDINIFSAMQRAEFLRAYGDYDPAKPAPWEAFTAQIPITEREANMAWMSPAPGINQFLGHRRLGNIDAINYRVPILKFDGSYEVLNDDVKDDQVGGYKLKPQELASKARLFPGREVLRVLAAGGSNAGFDGSNFFADSHTLGTGDNNLAENFASNDGVSHVAILLFHGNPLKPLIWFNREDPQLEDDGDTKQSKFADKTKFWADLRGAAAYGYWWDAVKVSITDTPTVAEFSAMLGNIETAFRSFKMPKSVSSDRDEYPHEQTQFSTSNCTLLVSSKLGAIARAALTLGWLPAGSSVATENLYKGYANLVVSAILDP